jgi:hypothetical protein
MDKKMQMDRSLAEIMEAAFWRSKGVELDQVTREEKKVFIKERVAFMSGFQKGIIFMNGINSDSLKTNVRK